MLKRFRDIWLICRKATGAVYAYNGKHHSHDTSKFAQKQHHLFHFLTSILNSIFKDVHYVKTHKRLRTVGYLIISGSKKME